MRRRRRSSRGGGFAVRTVAVATLLAVSGALYVCERVAMVSVGYRIDAARREVTHLADEQRRLLVELDALTSPARMAGLAPGFAPPEVWQVVRVSVAGAPLEVPRPWPQATAQRPGFISHVAECFVRGLGRLHRLPQPHESPQPLAERGASPDES